jgi:hypothetical protein
MTKKTTINKIIKEHEQLQQALANMLVDADEDCPSNNRTEHFRSSLKSGYSLLRKIGYFKREREEIIASTHKTMEIA